MHATRSPLDLFAFAGLFLACVTPLTIANPVVAPESVRQLPVKNPFEWPTFWSTESPVIAESAPSQEGLAALRNENAPWQSKRGRKFVARLGRLTPPEAKAQLAAIQQSGLTNSSGPSGAAPIRRWLQPHLLDEAPYLFPLQNGKVYPDECPISYHVSNESEILQPFDKLTLKRGAREGVQIGDLYQVYEVGPEAYAYGSMSEIGRKIYPKGLVEVISVREKNSVAVLKSCYGTISRNTRAAPWKEEMRSFTVNSYQKTSNPEPIARVVWIPQSGQIPQPFTAVVVDMGHQGGFRLGDHVMLFNQKSGKFSERLLGEGLVIRAEAGNATLLVHDVLPGIINPGDYAMVRQNAL